MSYAPVTLVGVGDAWKSHGGTNLGIVGSMKTHRRGYHLGKDRIFATGIAPSCASTPTAGTCTAGEGWNDSSVQTARDKAGLTNAAAAIDLGPLNGVAGSEVAFAKWLIGQCQGGAPDTKDIRAVNYTIYRWDRQKGQTSSVYVHSVNETGHVHVEFYRDSRDRSQRAVFDRYFATTGTGAQEVDIVGLIVTLPANPAVGTLKLAAGVDTIRVSDGAHYKLPASATRQAYAAALGGQYSGPGYLFDAQADELHFVREGTGAQFTAASGSPVTPTKLAPGIYEVAA
jgi:hypothetical protein